MATNTTPNQQNLEDKNAAYAADFRDGDLPLPPAKKYAVVTCMDSRIDAVNAFGITLGDAHIIRNAGGSAVEALRSLIISQQFLGTREIIIIKHTGCGMLTFNNDSAKVMVEERLGKEARKEAEGMDWLCFPDLDQSVREDVELLNRTKLIPEGVVVSGWVYHVETGKVRRIA